MVGFWCAIQYEAPTSGHSPCVQFQTKPLLRNRSRCLWGVGGAGTPAAKKGYSPSLPVPAVIRYLPRYRSSGKEIYE